jgi:hypothetical protein
MSAARRSRTFTNRSATARAAVATAALLVGAQVATVSVASAQPSAGTPPTGAAFVDLGTAATYSILAGTGVANTGAGTVLSGDLGLSPSGAIAGFGPGTVNGTTHDKDNAAATAQSDRAAAYAAAAAEPNSTAISGDQAGVTFHPGVYSSAAAFSNTGVMTLDADANPSAVFVFQIGAAMSPAAGSEVKLTDGALANNVFWQVTGAVSLGAGAKYVGTLLGAGAITFGDGASIKGRALTPGSIAVTNSPFTQPIDDLTAPLLTIDGGATASTNDTTPPISGTTDEAPGSSVTVAVGGQTLNASVVAGGAWAVSAGALSLGAHDVAASITDASQNTGSASQVLTVDTTAPAVTIDGGATVATNDDSPTISGTTDAPADAAVAVVVGGQTLTTTVGVNGTWTVHAATLTEAPHLVMASLEDAAQNTGTARQILSVDLTVPVVAIDGGATRSTADTSPWIYGTTAEQAGTTVHVAIGGQSLTATVLTGGTWGVSATALPTGAQQVVASITDAASNTGTAAQTLTITGGGVPHTAHYQPDGAIRTLPGHFVGVGIYDITKERVATRLHGSARTARFEVRVTNRGDSTDRMKLTGTSRNNSFKVSYLSASGQDVTRAVTAGAYLTGRLAAGRSTHVIVTVTRTKTAETGDRRTFRVHTVSWHGPTASDTVAAAVRLTR